MEYTWNFIMANQFTKSLFVVFILKENMSLMKPRYEMAHYV